MPSPMLLPASVVACRLKPRSRSVAADRRSVRLGAALIALSDAVRSIRSSPRLGTSPRLSRGCWRRCKVPSTASAMRVSSSLVQMFMVVPARRRGRGCSTAGGRRRSGRGDRGPSVRLRPLRRLQRRSAAAGSSSSVIVTRASASLAGSPPCWPFMLLQAAMVDAGAFGVVVDRQLGPDRRGSFDEQLGAEEAGFDDRRADAERLDVEAQRLHPALHSELACRVGGDELLADQPGRRRDRDDVPRPLPAHHRQHRTGDVHRPEQVRFDLCAHLGRADLLEVAGVEVAGVVDEHVDPTEPVDGSPDGRLGRGSIGDVEIDRQQIVVAHRVRR